MVINIYMKKSLKRFYLDWAFEPFQNDPLFFSKRMFGGLAAYVDGRLVMVLCENPGDRKWKDKQYPYDIWNGILIPTEREFHADLQKEFPNLVNHPVLPKWLYLPMSTKDFESTVERISNLIAKKDERLGVNPKPKLN